MRVFFIFFILIILQFNSKAQCDNSPGQCPTSTFPVCGTSVFVQNSVPLRAGKRLPGPCNTDGVTDINPYWYQFTCYQAGTLGFEITPNNLNDDYDWQLYDITGRDPNDVYADGSMVVAANWSGLSGKTGASSAGNQLMNCGGNSYPNYSAMPTLQLNHTYILLVSHFTSSQSGYTLSFQGGTASIANPVLPSLLNTSATCDASTIYVKLSKPMKRSSLTNTGNEFSLSSPGINVINATPINNSNSFEMDSIALTLDNPLPPGDHFVIIKNGSDGNTLLDNCDVGIPENEKIEIKISKIDPTPMNKMTPLKCAPQQIELLFDKGIKCNSIVSDGSDFIITGSSPVTILSATGNCNNGLTRSIIVSLSAPIIVGGNYQITLKNGSDGNTIIDSCGQETLSGASISFDLKSTVSADFTYQLSSDCKSNTAQFNHDGNNGVNEWKWNINNQIFTIQNPAVTFLSYGSKTAELIVSNGFCADTSSQTIVLDNEVKADFETNSVLCPEDSASFVDRSIGKNLSYQWLFDNGESSILKDPPTQKYPVLLYEKNYQVRLIVKNIQCADTTFQTIKVLMSCHIAVPTAFTPNGDGLNDFLYPLNAFNADSLEFRVYNRAGQIIFKSFDPNNKWDGTVSGKQQPIGNYAWVLNYVERNTGKRFSIQGKTALIR